MLRRILSTLVGLSLLVPLGLHAQAPDYPPLNAENLASFNRQVRLDFETVRAEGLQPGSGLFVVSADAGRVVTFANAPEQSPLSTAVIWDGYTGALLDTLYIGDNQYDRAINADGSRLAVAKQDGAAVFDLRAGRSLTSNALPLLPVPILTHVWFAAGDDICGETSPEAGGTSYVICSDGREALPLPLGGGDLVRIGRVPPPLAVTTREDGHVSRWNLESGALTAEADAGDIAVFGAVNGSGSHLAWRDPMSQALYLLDFVTGETTRIAALEGEYIAHMQLTRTADVILGIDPASARGTVAAWRVASGERVSLGDFRPCERQQPDMARLSPDGSALVIGCDLGLDIWRIDS